MSLMNVDEVEHRSEVIGAVPIVRHFMERIGLDELLERFVPPKKLGRQPKVSHARALSVMITNVLLSRRPLYGVPTWVGTHPCELFGLDDLDVSCLNDDRIGRALDRIYESEPSSLMTAVVTKVIGEFEIDLTQIHNDSTTVTFSGGYEGQKSKEELDRPPLITFGHNKDHRPDLKQLVYSLTISSDGAVPVHYKCYDGNTTDDKTHIETWKTVREIRGCSQFMYVADSKLCTRENMRFIDEEGGRFVTTMPRSRKEYSDFRSYIQTDSLPWEEVFRKEAPEGSNKPDQVYESVELSTMSAEGFRIVWYRSSVKLALDEKRRFRKIMRARENLEQLADRSGAHAFRSVDAARQAADKVLEKEGAKRWLAVEFGEETVFDLKQTSSGRPGPDTKYHRVKKGVRITFHIEENVDVIQADARCDGIFAMMTNEPKHSHAELLRIYKYQPFLEKRNEQLKSVLAVAPIFLKKPERVAALLFIYFLAILIFALIEREIRITMRKAKIDALPTYHENRDCRAPTADAVLRTVESHRRYHLMGPDGDVLRTFHDTVSPVARMIIKLLKISKSHYGM